MTGSIPSGGEEANSRRPITVHRLRLAAGILASAMTIFSQCALADEGGVSFWVPGFFGSLSAAPQQPGWSLATVYYHTSVSAGSDVALARELQTGRVPANLSARLNASLTGTGDLGFVIPSYVFATPVLGGQAAFALVGAYGVTSASVAGTLSGNLATPVGSIPFMRSDSFNDTTWGFADLIPQFSLRWNAGVNNFMTYVTGDIPVGAYQSTRLANLGLGHGAIDAGGGYTYFNPATGHELSAVLGFTYNFLNPSTQYQSGVDMHLDWGASQFLTKQVQVGLVGYAYKELGCDSGSGDRVGCFRSQVFGVGPQFGYVFPLSEGLQGYINLMQHCPRRPPMRWAAPASTATLTPTSLSGLARRSCSRSSAMPRQSVVSRCRMAPFRSTTPRAPPIPPPLSLLSSRSTSRRR